MAKWRIPRATTAERAALTPDAGELIYDENLGKVFFGDGSTVGGTAFASGDVAAQDTGWGSYQDATYTSTSPLTVNNAREQITNDGAGSNTEVSFLPSFGDLWDTTNNKILMETVGDAWQLRVDFKGETSTSNAFFDLQLDIGGGGSIIIVQKTLTFLKGTNTEQKFSETVSGFSLDTFISNGCKIYLDTTGDPCDCDFYDFSLKIERTYDAGA